MRSAQTFRGKVEHEQRGAAYIGRISELQRGQTSTRVFSVISSPGSSTRMPTSAHLSSGSLSAALAWVTGSATQIPPAGGE